VRAVRIHLQMKGMALTTIADPGRRVTVGIDTHGEVHVVAVLDERGRLLATGSFATTSSGHRRLERWAVRFGAVEAFGVEGTGAWGAGVARHLAAAGHRVVEVDRPDRSTRRRRGKSDTIDAEAAARAVQSGTAAGVPKARNGRIESIRALRVARRSALKARSQAAHQLHCLVSTAPDGLRDELRTLGLGDLVVRAARFRPGDTADPMQATKAALRSVARRHRRLTDEIAELDADLDRLVASVAPNLVALNGVGTDVAGQLLVTAGDNPGRLRSEAAFAHLCGVSPIPASSGRTDRHRLNRGGDRHANAALYRIVLCRLRWDPRTLAYRDRRTKDGLSKAEIIRCLKRYVAREVYSELTRLPA
jgi:transposase